MKFFKYLVLAFFSFIWIAGCNGDLLKGLYKWELIPDDYGLGDLYRITNLEQFRDPRYICPPYIVKRDTLEGKNVHLYILGDSFAEARRLDPDDFVASEYRFTHWNDQLHLQLDTSAKNVLIMETVERAFRSHFNSPVDRIVPDSATYVALPKSTLMQRLDAMFSSNATEGRLDVILFYTSPFRMLKEWKAGFNLRFFDRINEHATLSDDGKDVVYYLDTDTSMNFSSYATLADSEVDQMVDNVNTSAKELEKMGFDKVILSIIPNKATVLMPRYGPYNRLIERVYQHPDLRVDYIDILPEFRKNAGVVYLRSDSHWTCQGQYVWLEKANALIRQ